jgi:hypothetical protein
MTINKNFVVRNGLEVAEDILYVNDETRRVGISSAIPDFGLDVNTNMGISGYLSVGGTSGQVGTFLESTGDGLRWSNVPDVRVRYTYEGVDGQALYPPTGFAPYDDISLVDVYVDGVLLSQGEYNAFGGNTRIELVVPTVAGETVDIIVYNPATIGAGASGITGITIADEGVVTGDAEHVTMINFVGAAVTALQSGAGVTVYIGDTDVRAEGFWGSNLEWAPLGPLSGIHTTAFVGIGSTVPTVELDVRGSVQISGVATARDLHGYGIGVTGLTNSNLSGSAAISNNNIANPNVSYGGIQVSLGSSDPTPAFDLSDATDYRYSALTGITTDILGDTTPQLGGNLDLNTRTITGNGNININGALRIGGVSTFTGAIDANGNVDIDGFTDLDDLNVTGIATFTGNIDANGDVDVDGHTELDNLRVSGITTFQNYVNLDSFLRVSGVSTFVGTLNAGIVTASDFFGNGAGISSIVAISTEPPAGAQSGDLWFDSDLGKGFVYYDDGNSKQWVDFSGFGAATGGSGGIADVVNDTTPQLGGNLDLNGNNINGTGNIIINGGVNATTFIGDGSGLSGIVGSGSGVVVRDNGSLVGTAGTIDFSTGLSVTPIFAGIVTVTSSGVGTENVQTNTLTVAGVATFRGTNNTNVHLGSSGYAGVTWSGIGGVYTGNEPSILTNIGLGLDISGGIGDLTLSAPTSGGDVIIKAGNFSPTAISCIGNAQVEINHNGSKKFETLGTGATVTGTTFTNQLSVSGVSTLGVVTTGNIYSTGIITATTFVGNFSGSITDATNLTGGTANASSLNVSGIATISAGRIQVDASSNIRLGNLPAGSGSGRNIAIGDQVLASLSGGSGRNIGIGELSYYDTTTGQYNIGIGERAGQKVTTGAYNVILGAYDGNSGNLDIRTLSNNIVIADGQGNIRQYINSSGNVGIKTTVVTEALTVAGVVSATSFYGTLNAGQLTGTLPAIDGSALLNVVGSGSGVIVQDDATPVGTAGTINFGSNLSVSFASGIATVSGASSVSEATTAYGLAGTPNIYAGITTVNYLRAGNYSDINSAIIIGGDPASSSGGNISVSSKDLQIAANGFTNSDRGNIIFYRKESFLSKSEIATLYSDTGNLSIDGSLASGGTSENTFNGNIKVGTAVTLSTSGHINATGVITATSFYGSGANLTSLPAGQLTGALPAIDGSALLNVTAAGTGVAIEDNQVNVGSATTIDFGTGLDVTFSAGIATITASGGSLQSRTIVTGVTTSIANNGIGNTNITGFKSYALMKVGLSTAGWLRLYTDSTSRANDASRSVGIDPAPGSGVIAEVVTTGISTTQIISPFVMGGNLDNPADTTIYAAITNLSGSTQAITANLTILQLEA